MPSKAKEIRFRSFLFFNFALLQIQTGTKTIIGKKADSHLERIQAKFQRYPFKDFRGRCTHFTAFIIDGLPNQQPCFKTPPIALTVPGGLKTASVPNF